MGGIDDESNDMKLRLALLAACTMVVLTACGSGSEGVLPSDANITLRNTLVDQGEPETAYPALFGLPDDAFDEFATMSADGPEFATALAQADTPVGDISGLYEIDLSENAIDVTLLPTADDPFWVNVFEDFPAGKIDRYYLTFSDPHGISGWSSSDSTVSLRIDSPTVAVIEMRQGYSMNPGTSFTIDLE